MSPIDSKIGYAYDMTIRSYLAPLLFITLPALSAIACSGGLAGLCGDICDCSGCSDSELEKCESDAEKLEEAAADAGCEDQLDAFVDCLEAGFKCSGDNASFTDDCESETKSLNKCGNGVTAITPSGNVCDTAAEICSGGGGGEGQVPECNGLVECVSQCVVDNNSCTSPEVAECAAQC